MAKPVIMSVDDDPQVLSAIERDLRRNYRSEYRILKAASPHEALDAARQLKQRGTPVALFLVDQRMPEMTGTRFLAEVRDLHPESRRVLLTAPVLRAIRLKTHLTGILFPGFCES